MKLKRERTPSPWLVHDIYLRDTWGSPFNVSRSRRWNLRRIFLTAMILFGIVDACLAAFFVVAYLFPPRAVNTAQRNPTRAVNTAQRNPTRAVTTTAKQPSPTARRATRTPRPTNIPPSPTRAATRVPTRAPTPVPPPTEIIPPTAVPIPLRTLSVDLPASLNRAALTFEIPNEPAECTPADVMPDVVDRTIKLCAGQNYRPFLLRGEGLGVFGDKSSVIRSEGRGYAIIAEGARLFIQNVMIRGTTDARDANILLCLYPDCSHGNNEANKQGGVMYGGGILVRSSDTTIMDTDIAGGVAGVAAERVSGLKLINNRLDDSSGWGSYNFAVESSFFIGNTFSRDNRACNTPSGYLPTGCESAGWLCIACQQNIIAKNFCVNSGDCFYMNGEGNLASNNNRFHQNECRAAPHNCYEVTFAVGNEFVENIARDDPETGAACKYPFWVGGSQVVFARNSWRCNISPETSIEHAAASTHIPTKVENR